MEPMLATEVALSMVGKKRKDANDIVKGLLSKYEDRIADPSMGKKYQECFDVKSATPSKEYVELYKETKKEMEDLGIIEA
jgi:methylamine--corrinoid protein Co-methyltransferase